MGKKLMRARIAEGAGIVWATSERGCEDLAP